ncbi:hypothetical protein EW146_g9504 [Bondarzewia mesenterica]|uniref:Uncharacterized protein n=1 Tax=Bondarzewia mesenterica TaxID=1095465 RepID=A0A4V3XCS2_9AGAM|nr:hypothetical protein EW146_g9504 [Bondarzewia mesenterica]
MPASDSSDLLTPEPALSQPFLPPLPTPSPPSHTSSTRFSDITSPARGLTLSQKDSLKIWSDRVAVELRLDDKQVGDLHLIVELGKNLEPGDLQIRIWHLARQYQLLNIFEKAQGNAQKLTTTIEDLKTLSHTNFKLNREQTNHLLRQSKEMAFQPDRTSWMQLHVELEQTVRNHTGFISVFGNDWREKVLRDECKEKARSARNQLRLAIFNCLRNLRGGGPGALLAIEFQLHVALLRHFTLENMQDYFGFAEETGSAGDSSLEPVSKKRKGTGKVVKGQDYWSLVDTWFSDKISQWGSDQKAPAWQEYIRETIRLDHDKFKMGPGTLMQPLPMTMLQPEPNVASSVTSSVLFGENITETAVEQANPLAMAIE